MKLFGLASLGLLALAEERTILSWTRSVEGCDKDMDIPQATSRLIYAIGPDNDKIKGDNPSLKFHSKYGSESVALRLNEPPKSDGNEDDSFFDFKVPKIKIPARAINDPEESNRTSYICGLADVPDWVMDGKKRHLTKISPVINPNNMGKVHHILVYMCTGDVTTLFESQQWRKEKLNVAHACQTSESDDKHNFPIMPEVFAGQCATIIAAWAIGGGALSFPPEAGYPMGTDSFSHVYYEIHYDNFDQKAFEDDSGLRFHVTEDLREFDAGVLQVGAVDGIEIPEQEEAFDLKLRCPGSKDGSACLDTSVLGEEGVTITHTMMHGHLAARSVVSNLVDESGNIVTKLGNEKYYDFNLQAFFELEKPVQLEAGNNIDITCTYNTMDRSEPTVGGLGSLQEMCIGFFIYYPRKQMTACTQLIGSETGSDEGRFYQECGWPFGLEEDCGTAVTDCFQKDEKCTQFWTEGDVGLNLSECLQGNCHGNDNFENSVQCFFNVVEPCVNEKRKNAENGNGDEGSSMNAAMCSGGPGIGKVASFPEFNVVEKEKKCKPVKSKDLDVVAVDGVETGSDLTEFFKGYVNKLTLMEEPRYELYWTYHSDRQEIDFAVDVATTGWVGLGISPNGGMVGADVMMGWVTDGGDVHITDRYAAGKFMPAIDKIQSLSNMRGFRFSGGDDGGDGGDGEKLDYSKDCKSITDLIECVARVNCDALEKKGKKEVTLRKCNPIPCKKLKSEKACLAAKDSGCKTKYKKKTEFLRCK